MRLVSIVPCLVLALSFTQEVEAGRVFSRVRTRTTVSSSGCSSTATTAVRVRAASSCSAPAAGGSCAVGSKTCK